jgi:hypothetical protein
LELQADPALTTALSGLVRHQEVYWRLLSGL